MTGDYWDTLSAIPAAVHEGGSLYLRHESAPTPLGCRWCGVPEREHGQRHVPPRGFHPWAEPTRDQIEARLRARLAPQERAETKEYQ